MKKTFNDGSVLLTGEDMRIALEAVLNRRGRYDRTCHFCLHEGDENYCLECSALDTDRCCSCHLNAPCSWCISLKFEVSPYLLNYRHYKQHRKKWECIKGDKESFEKLERIEAAGFSLAAETLRMGEISITIEDDQQDYEFEICQKQAFLEGIRKIIMSFDLNTKHFTE